MMLKIKSNDDVVLFVWDGEVPKMSNTYYIYECVTYQLRLPVLVLERTRFTNSMWNGVERYGLSDFFKLPVKLQCEESSWAEYRIMKNFSNEKILFKEVKSSDWNQS